MIGHTLKVKHWNAPERRYDFFSYTIIGTRRNRFGLSDYFIPVWDNERQFFRSYSANSYFLVEVSASPVVMDASTQAAADFIHYNRMANYCETIRRSYAVGNFAINKQAVGSLNPYGGTTYRLEDSYELDMSIHADITERARAKRDKYRQLAQAALSASGLRAEAVQA